MTRLRVATIGLALLAAIGTATISCRPGDSGGAEETVTEVAVHVDRISRATLHRSVSAYGYVEPAPSGKGRPAAGATVSPIAGGVLETIGCAEGQQVSKGAVLFSLESRAATVAVEKARKELEFAEQTAGRQQELLQHDGTSRRAAQEAEQRLETARADLAAAETELAYRTITAPLSGTLMRLDAAIGRYVDPSTVLAQVVDLDRLVVSTAVPVNEAAGVSAGQAAFIGPDAGAAQGAVTLVGRDADPRTGTRLVQVSLPPGSGRLPGQFTEVRIVTEEHPEVLVIPEAGLVSRPDEGTWVMVVEGERAVRKPVSEGLHDRGLVEVSGEGIAEGVTIVTEDAYSLPPETRIRIIGN